MGAPAYQNGTPFQWQICGNYAESALFAHPRRAPLPHVEGLEVSVYEFSTLTVTCTYGTASS
jgi:hypothetical protein